VKVTFNTGLEYPAADYAKYRIISAVIGTLFDAVG
jgi:hypothetical protein